MIKTNKEIDVASYSEQSSEMKKLVFSKIRTITDKKSDKFTIHFEESKIIDENIETQVEVIDENGDFVVNEDTGEQEFTTETKDVIERLRNVSTTIPRETYYAIAAQVLSKAPNGLTRKQEDDLIVEMGIKIYITTGGFYKGQLTMVDFE